MLILDILVGILSKYEKECMANVTPATIHHIDCVV